MSAQMMISHFGRGGLAGILLTCLAVSVTAAQEQEALVEPRAQMTTINGLEGPSQAAGIQMAGLGVINLGEAFPNISGAGGHMLRARHVTVAPNGVIPVHSHAGRPAVTFVVEGAVTEYRSDVEGPIKHGAGAVTIDDEGVAQWWRNDSDAVVLLFVVDLAPIDAPDAD